jgi:hypothetical protein
MKMEHVRRLVPWRRRAPGRKRMLFLEELELRIAPALLTEIGPELDFPGQARPISEPLSDQDGRRTRDATDKITWQGREVEVVRGEWIAAFEGNAPITPLNHCGGLALEHPKFAALDANSDNGNSPTRYLVNTGSCTPSQAQDWLTHIPGFRYAEPNFVVSADVTPNDPSYSQLWGLNNANDRDIDAPEAWDLAKGSNAIVVGVIDTGVDYNHPDLAANMWTNPLECPAGPGTCVADSVDNDLNGYIDDFYGWDFVNEDNDPFDDNSHGTHVAGTIGAVGNNGQGVVGVNWTTRIMAIKAFGAGGTGTTADAIQAIEYATKMKRDHGINVRVTNNSWGGGGDSQALRDAITASGQQNMLFIAAAGNSTTNTDNSPHYPSSYNFDNIIAVASTTDQDALSSFGGPRLFDLQHNPLWPIWFQERNLDGHSARGGCCGSGLGCRSQRDVHGRANRHPDERRQPRLSPRKNGHRWSPECADGFGASGPVRRFHFARTRGSRGESADEFHSNFLASVQPVVRAGLGSDSQRNRRHLSGLQREFSDLHVQHVAGLCRRTADDEYGGRQCDAAQR